MDPLKLIKTQKPLGFLQSNPQILAEWVEPIVFIKNKILKNTLLNSIFMEWNRLMHFFCKIRCGRDCAPSLFLHALMDQIRTFVAKWDML